MTCSRNIGWFKTKTDCILPDFSNSTFDIKRTVLKLPYPMPCISGVTFENMTEEGYMNARLRKVFDRREQPTAATSSGRTCQLPPSRGKLGCAAAWRSHFDVSMLV